MTRQEQHEGSVVLAAVEVRDVGVEVGLVLGERAAQAQQVAGDGEHAGRDREQRPPSAGADGCAVGRQVGGLGGGVGDDGHGRVLSVDGVVMW
jgi:hypothetical protein